MLVHGQGVFVGAELLELPAHPVREVGIHLGDRFACFARPAPTQRCTAAARLVGNDNGESFVLGAGPHRRLAQARMTDDRNPAGVGVRIGFQIIEHAAEAPGPGADGAPIVGREACVGSVRRFVFQVSVVVTLVPSEQSRGSGSPARAELGSFEPASLTLAAWVRARDITSNTPSRHREDAIRDLRFMRTILLAAETLCKVPVAPAASTACW